MLFSLHSNLGFMEMFCHFAIWTVTAPHGLSFFDMCRIITLYDHDKYPTLILVFPSKNTKKKKQNKNSPKKSLTLYYYLLVIINERPKLKHPLKKLLIIFSSNSYKNLWWFYIYWTCHVHHRGKSRAKSKKFKTQVCKAGKLLLTWCHGW